MPKARTIALFGGSFNPPGNHHAAIAAKLSELFDEVRVIPCGPRPDKPVTGTVPPVFRAALADLVFGGMPKVIVDLSDFEQDTFTRNFELEERFSSDPALEPWHVVGEDLIAGGAHGQSAIQRTWAKGTELWETANFAVLRRPGYESTAAPSTFIADLPPNARIIDLVVEGASTTIRDRLNRGEDVSAMLSARALAYIERYGLYRAPIPNNWARGTLHDLRYFLCGDTASARVQAVTARLGLTMPPPEESEGLDAPRGRTAHSTPPPSTVLRPPLTASTPGFIAVVGGDGAMLRCIREHWRARLPFFGINAGHIGFLMNGEEQVQDAGLPPADVIFRQLPMLFLEFEDAAGNKTTAYGFNDAWLERATAQSAWLEVSVNGIPRIPKLVSDGALVATAAGSTAYARSMGASPLLADTPAWLLVGSNVLQPAHWRSALLSPDTTVDIRSLNTDKRPVVAYVDGQSIGPVVSMRARLSRAAAAELVFCASHDMAEKIAAIQFGA